MGTRICNVLDSVQLFYFIFFLSNSFHCCPHQDPSKKYKADPPLEINGAQETACFLLDRYYYFVYGRRNEGNQNGREFRRQEGK